MLALLQRVSHAKVVVAAKTIAKIERGILVFLGVEKNDTEQMANRLAERILGYRIFADDTGRMNLNVIDTAGSLLLVPQFTLAADTKKGMRPSFTPAADPELGEKLFDYCAATMRQRYEKIACGQFGADMQVSLCNDGPVTFWLQQS